MNVNDRTFKGISDVEWEDLDRDTKRALHGNVNTTHVTRLLWSGCDYMVALGTNEGVDLLYLGMGWYGTSKEQAMFYKLQGRMTYSRETYL